MTKSMKRLFPFFLMACLSAQAETPLWIHDCSISPDGKEIAFSYKGELFTVGIEGGNAKRLTSDPGFDGKPVWTPDNKYIAFSSDRRGSDDIFLIAATGGTPRRLTTFSRNEEPLTFINDSILLFNTQYLPGEKTSRAPFLTQIYCLNINRENDKPKLYLSLPVNSASANAKGELLLEDRKGFEDVLRKHERSSGTSDIILKNQDNFSKLTDFNGNDKSPAWGKDNKYYYISEADGTLNVYEGTIGGKSNVQLTKFVHHPVRSLTASDNDVLAFTWDGSIYTLSPGKEPRKLDVIINEDLYDADVVKRYLRSGADNGAVSADGSQIAVVIRGEVYVTDSEYTTTKRITNTPWQERTVSFSPDGRTLVFDSDKDGVWQLFTATIDNPNEKSFAFATDITIEPLYKCKTSAMQPQFSPDGKKVAFLENRDALRVIDLKTKETTTVIDGKYNYSYSDGDIPFSWSPDSQWLLTTYIGEGGWNNIDIALAKADGTEIVNLTESGYANENPKWALDGKGITYVTGRYGMKSHASWGNQSDIVLMILDPSAWEEFNLTEEEAKILKKSKNDDLVSQEDEKTLRKKKNEKEEQKDLLKFDLKNRKYHSVRLTPNSTLLMDYFLNNDGDKLYFISNSTEDDFSLYEVDLKEKETVKLLKDAAGLFMPDLKGENIFIFGPDGINKISFDERDLKPVAYEAEYDRHPSKEREYIYGHIVNQVKDKFYDPDLHGVDWDYYSEHYKEFLPSISNNRDFATLLSELLGELNASHTGARYKAPETWMQTPFLGAYFDEEYDGDGLLISEIFPTGPLSLHSAGLTSGDVILAIDGSEVGKNKDYFPLLEGKEGKKVRLKIKTRSGNEKFVTVKPMSNSMIPEMSYRRWIDNNEKYVDSISGGKIAYIHVRGMDGESFQEIYDKLLGKYRNCDAVVVDTRWNGGGWLHNDLAILLSGKKYVTFAPRGKEIGIEPFSQWTKHSVMLVNESNYSDAHGSPFAYKALDLGKIIGAPIPGTMTAVWWENQIDPTLVFGIPQVTNVANDGMILENSQLDPDILIYNSPEDVEKGIDSQLEGAVNYLLGK